MQLIYRGHIYEYTPRPVQPYVKPRALNWRYQPVGENFENTPGASHHSCGVGILPAKEIVFWRSLMLPDNI